jgi:hypothetical protein
MRIVVLRMVDEVFETHRNMLSWMFSEILAISIKFC